jgi:hypothetical protein
MPRYCLAGQGKDVATSASEGSHSHTHHGITNMSEGFLFLFKLQKEVLDACSSIIIDIHLKGHYQKELWVLV